MHDIVERQPRCFDVALVVLNRAARVHHHVGDVRVLRCASGKLGALFNTDRARRHHEGDEYVTVSHEVRTEERIPGRQLEGRERKRCVPLDLVDIGCIDQASLGGKPGFGRRVAVRRYARFDTLAADRATAGRDEHQHEQANQLGASSHEPAPDGGRAVSSRLLNDPAARLVTRPT